MLLRKMKLIVLTLLLLMFVSLGYSFYKEYSSIKNIQNIVNQEKVSGIRDFILSFRSAHQEMFIDKNIDLNSGTIELLPIRSMNSIISEFEKKDDNIKISLASVRPRNLANTASKRQKEVIKYFNETGSDTFVEKINNDSYVYSYSMRIESSCLRCHGKKENAPKYIRENFQYSYDYKLGDVKAIIEFKVNNSDDSLGLNDIIKGRIIQMGVLLIVIIVITILLFITNSNTKTNTSNSTSTSNSKMLIVLFIIMFLLVNLFTYIISEDNANERINVTLNENLKRLDTHYNMLLKTQRGISSAIFASILRNTDTINIMNKFNSVSIDEKNLLRDKLNSQLRLQYKSASLQGVLQIQFVDTKNISILRVHKPSKYGDNLTDIRDDYKYVNENRKAISVFSQGRISHGFRNTFPVFNNSGVHIGAMEISFKSESLQKFLTEINHIDTHFLVNKGIYETKVWKEDDLILKYKQSLENSNLMVNVSDYNPKIDNVILNRKKLLNKKAFIDKKIELGDDFSFYNHYNNSYEVISFLAIKNLENKTVAWLVSYENSNFLKLTIDGRNYIRIFILIFSIFVLFIVFSQVKSKKDLKDLNKSLEMRIQEALEKNTKQLQLLQEQNKMASMGEMIGAIAHQWRQPLGVISIGIQNLKYDFEDGNLNDGKYIDNFIAEQNKTVRFMSKTIDDFRGFFRTDKITQDFKVLETTESVFNMLSAQLKNHDILLKIKGEEFKFHGLETEYQQVILNVISNCKDAHVMNKTKGPYIEIIVENKSVIIKDNAGGIPKDIIDRVFEPYFTTKEQGKGTGMGLYMSKMIIEENMNGKISVKNSDNGAVFKIEFSD